MSSPSSARSFAACSLLALLAALTACSGGDDDDAAPNDAGSRVDLNLAGDCPASDGTIASECERFACQYRNASLALCPGSTTLLFRCRDVDSFPVEYQDSLRPYFTNCAESLDQIVDTEVETTTGPVVISACDILGCVNKWESQRLFMGGPNIMANCAPVPSPACDFPDPPPLP